MRALPALFLLLGLTACTADPVPSRTEAGVPCLVPDYTGVTIPRTIAPLNFRVPRAERVVAEWQAGDRRLTLHSSASVRIPRGAWQRLLAATDTLRVTLTVLCSGEWVRYAPFEVYVSDDPIDYGICYRRLDPGYELYGEMGIYYRPLSGQRERCIVRNTMRPGQCMNCHSFAQGDPERMQLHLRGAGGGTVLRTGGKTVLLDTRTPQTGVSAVYPYWHPSGRYIAYSVNDIRQLFHNTPDEVLDVYDLRSDVVIYDVDRGEMILPPELMRPDRMETFPAFSPDGQTLYFTVADSVAAGYDNLRDIRYTLCSTPFDPERGIVGPGIDTLWYDPCASASFPRPAPDGRWLLFTRSAYGNFTVWHSDADLWLLDLKTLRAAPAAALNSPDTESYHAWSSSGHWVVFSSRRDDGRHTRLYIAHADGHGGFSKPFRLPQRDPRHDEELLQSYNIPEFITAPVRLDPSAIRHAKPVSVRVRTVANHQTP